MDFTHSAKSLELQQRMQQFIADNLDPFEQEYFQLNEQLNPDTNWRNWQVVPETEALKAKAKAAGLWNLFLPDAELGAGLSVLEYAPLAELTGRSLLYPEVFNCNAPDTGNMEVLYHFGNEQQKAKWLTPLLAGEIRSVFFMTEPGVASSDATNMAATITEDGDDLILNGRKWWSSGVGHPNCKVGVFMGLSNPDNPKHQQHSMVLVELDTPGITIERMLTAAGESDAPYGHGEVNFDNVRVPKTNLIQKLGDGFAIAQGRLGPGRIHHCMRCIGAAERVLEMGIKRAMSRSAFGRPIIELGGNRERIADARLAIDQARLLTYFAAWKVDNVGVKQAMTEISAIKVAAPNMLQDIVDMVMQLHGGAGMGPDFGLMRFYAQARSLRLADGPDEVHKGMLSRLELRKYK
ncbi:acyl-CoA dehydrogenase family protein [Ferrimonas lipolytica]|uniref:Acyl-CoA dehydrogenase n=1 Tax=Ferrimonas lipolytica TaxID=2724191 RepID=A0A6H1UHY8_9GAMM|nr:acyl-CoA dehydrogenase family protein [Ferrimonas lipolytica]QIZ78725.1 acyl-CoA dehydrogenase [Ferrimonas lipolytica]